MRDDTPYYERPESEIEREVMCMERIFAQAEPVSEIYEAFGGTGHTAAVLHQRFPNAVITAFDIDAECCNAYNKASKGFGHCDCSDALFGISRFKSKGSWGASLDFNRFTLLDLTRREGVWKRELITQVCNREPVWVQITDSAVCYLGTNWKRYGLQNKDLNAYASKLSASLKQTYGLKFVIYANHSRAAYLLFRK